MNVQGECPMGCGNTLFLGEGGYVTCSYAHCPEPDAASKLLFRGPATNETVIADLKKISRKPIPAWPS